VAEIILPDDLTTIGEWAFYGSGITEIELGKKITYIGSLAFAMTGIETINIPDSVTQIDGTLAYAISLKSATIGSGVTSIPESCFMACGSLSSVAFSNSVKSIELCAFDACEECLKYISMAQKNNGSQLSLKMVMTVSSTPPSISLVKKRKNATISLLNKPSLLHVQ
ncbi:MAG: leucine-rich repeat domain-containing protein, partial [Clostridia bacterium]|nr:leucine-rich repeat domain-containing protein [Clostridia bacterium]